MFIIINGLIIKKFVIDNIEKFHDNYKFLSKHQQNFKFIYLTSW